jgi:hypothetical protein
LITNKTNLSFIVVRAQHDTKRVEQYCELVASARIFSSKVNINIDYGEEKSIWKDNRLKDDNVKAGKFNSVIDAINYMGQMGWTLVIAFPISDASGQAVYHYVYKKDFPKSETE